MISSYRVINFYVVNYNFQIIGYMWCIENKTENNIKIMAITRVTTTTPNKLVRKRFKCSLILVYLVFVFVRLIQM